MVDRLRSFFFFCYSSHSLNPPIFFFVNVFSMSSSDFVGFFILRELKDINNEIELVSYRSSFSSSSLCVLSRGARDHDLRRGYGKLKIVQGGLVGEWLFLNSY